LYLAQFLWDIKKEVHDLRQSQKDEFQRFQDALGAASFRLNQLEENEPAILNETLELMQTLKRNSSCDSFLRFRFHGK